MPNVPPLLNKLQGVHSSAFAHYLRGIRDSGISHEGVLGLGEGWFPFTSAAPMKFNVAQALIDDPGRSLRTCGGPRHGIGASVLVEAAGLVSGLLVQMTAARGLSTTDYGRFAVLSVVELVALVLLGGGIPQALRHLVSRNPDNLLEAVRWLVQVQLPLSVGVALALASGMVPLGHLLSDHDIVPLLPILGFAVLIRCGLLEPSLQLLNGARHYVKQTLVGITYHVLRVASIAWFVGSSNNLPLTLISLAMAASLSAALAVAFVWKLCRRTNDVADADFATRARTWVQLSPGYEVLMFLLISSNLWVVKAQVADPAIVGMYAACFMLARSTTALGRVAIDGTFPTLTTAFSEGRADLMRATVFATTFALAMLLIPAGALTLVCGEAIIRLLFGARYNGSGRLLGLLFIGTASSSIMLFFGGVLGASGVLRGRLLVATAVSLVGVATTVALTRFAGPTGAACSLMLTGTIGASLMALLVRSVVGPFILWPSSVRFYGFKLWPTKWN